MLLTFSWEQRRLGEVCEIIMGQSPSSNNYSSEPCGYILVQGNADIEDGWVTPRVWTTEITKIGKCNDIIMSVRAPAGSVGRTKYDVVLGRGVAAIKGNNFVYRQLEKMEFCRYWKRLASGSTFESLSTAHLKSATIAIPEGREQMMIGNFFELLDHYITVQQRKLVSKDEVMNLFLCKSNTLVDVDVYANSWEQRRLGEVANIYDGTHQTPKYEKNGIMFLSVENIDTLKSDKYISEKAFKDEYKNYPQKNDILMTRIGDVGRVNIVETEELIAFYVSLALLKPFNIVSKFLLVEMQSSSFQRQLRRRTLVTAIPQKINKEEIGRITIFVPYEEEQRKIGHLLRRIDHHITFQQRM